MKTSRERDGEERKLKTSIKGNLKKKASVQLLEKLETTNLTLKHYRQRQNGLPQRGEYQRLG